MYTPKNTPYRNPSAPPRASSTHHILHPPTPSCTPQKTPPTAIPPRLRVPPPLITSYIPLRHQLHPIKTPPTAIPPRLRVPPPLIQLPLPNKLHTPLNILPQIPIPLVKTHHLPIIFKQLIHRG